MKLFIMMFLAIPIDFIVWNLFFARSHGFLSPKECVEDNLDEYRNRRTIWDSLNVKDLYKKS